MRRRVNGSCVLLAAWLAACGGGGPDAPDGSPPGPDAPPPPDPAIAPAPDLLVAADPKLAGFASWPLAFLVEEAGLSSLSCRVTLARAGATLATVEAAVAQGRCVVDWDGGAGSLAPGAVEATAQLLDAAGAELADATTALEVVRLGVSEVHFGGADRAQLMYGALGGQSQGYWLVPGDRPAWRIGPDSAEGPGAVSLELADGTPRALPAPWNDLRSPPLDPAAPDGVEADTYNLPVAYVAGAVADVTATLSSDVAGAPGGGAPAQAELRVLVGGAVAGAFAHGAQVTVAIGDLAPMVGRYERELSFTFQARAPGGDFVDVPGAVRTRHVVYGLAGQPIFDYASTPHHAWVEIVDTVTRWVDGGTQDPDAVAARVVEGVYYELGLTYDNLNGASAYTWYPGFGWENAQFDLSAFTTREYGDVINCSDAASLVSTFSNMVGVDIRYHILQRDDGNGFDLNFIRPIGFMVFDETPFIGDRGRFSYHAVVGPPDGTFYDGTLALDHDGVPTAPPFTPLLAAGMLPDDYLFDLSSEWMLVATSMDEKVELR